MIERLTNEGECRPEQADRAAAERPRLCLTWHLDPRTGKPAARWICEAPKAGAVVATAA